MFVPDKLVVDVKQYGGADGSLAGMQVKVGYDIIDS